MRSNLLIILAISAILLTVSSCEDDKNGTGKSVLSAKLITHSDCKSMKHATVGAIADSISCADYTYNAVTKTMLVKHMNAGFNCGSDSLFCEVDLINDTILITESESGNFAQCECLFDLEIAITGIEPANYQIKFVEPYLQNQQPLQFSADLLNQNTGSYCVIRNLYPWGK
jgi:hypothetical protein